MKWVCASRTFRMFWIFLCRVEAGKSLCPHKMPQPSKIKFEIVKNESNLQPQQKRCDISIVSGDEELTLTNVIFGDVWLCSGQSNMFYFITFHWSFRPGEYFLTVTFYWSFRSVQHGLHYEPDLQLHGGDGSLSGLHGYQIHHSQEGRQWCGTRRYWASGFHITPIEHEHWKPLLLSFFMKVAWADPSDSRYLKSMSAVCFLFARSIYDKKLEGWFNFHLIIWKAKGFSRTKNLFL